MTERVRCWGDNDPLMAAYHDDEWGVPVHDDRALFEHLTLDGFQAGLSWRIILGKRDAFRKAFDHFEPRIVAAYGDEDLIRLGSDPGIVRNKLKIKATVSNAAAFLTIQEEFGSFDTYIWGFTSGKTLYAKPARTWQELPTASPEAEAMAADLKTRGFKFVGPTICYAFMQAVGIVDDHLLGCWRYKDRSGGA